MVFKKVSDRCCKRQDHEQKLQINASSKYNGVTGALPAEIHVRQGLTCDTVHACMVIVSRRAGF